MSKTIPDKSKFAIDSILNLAGVFLLGVFGIVFNVLIIHFYTAIDLGVFNQIYAVYVVFSQFSVLGIQNSTLKHIAQFAEMRTECNKIITSGLALCAISASFFTVLLFSVRGLLGNLLESPAVASGLPYVLPGLWCFAMNKLFMSILNGFEEMKAYAFFSSLRAIVMILGISALVIIRVDGHKLPLVFTIAESIVFVTIFFFTKRYFSFIGPGDCLDWVRKHLIFGIKSFSTGLIAELNTRIDIFILGIFSTDRIVGIYSFAAILVEGLGQIPFVLRRMFDPKLTKLIYSDLLADVRTLIRKSVLRTFCGMLVIYGSSALLFPHVIKLLTSNADFNASWIIFCILVAGALIQSSYIPFSGILIQGGYPGYQSLFILALCLTNTALNFILIPHFGMYGAAVATTISYILFAVYLKLFVYHAFQIKI